MIKARLNFKVVDDCWRRSCAFVLFGIALSAVSPLTSAQDASSAAVNLFVPFAPGGIADITARPLAIPLAKELGLNVVVQNRAGAGGAVGMAHVARQKPDGNTLLMALSSILIIP